MWVEVTRVWSIGVRGTILLANLLLGMVLGLLWNFLEQMRDRANTAVMH